MSNGGIYYVSRTQRGYIFINRMFHVQLKADAKQWINWAYETGLHPWVIDYITQRPDHLFSEPPKALTRTS